MTGLNLQPLDLSLNPIDLSHNPIDISDNILNQILPQHDDDDQSSLTIYSQGSFDKFKYEFFSAKRRIKRM